MSPVIRESPPPGVVRFGEFEADFRNGVVRKDGSRVKLQEQPFRILQILLDHPGELVTREELQRQIWPSDTFVDFEKGLNNAIKRLREALGDSADQPRFIETHPKRGYRFIGSVMATHGVHEAENEAVRSDVIEPPPWGVLYKRLAVGALILLLLIALLVGFNIGGKRFLGRESAPPIRSLAVLPLQNLSGDPTQEYFSDGLTDALITDLAQLGTVKVISRTSSMQYKQTKKSLPEIAHELNVDGIIEGAVQRSGDRVRITAQLVHGPSDKHLWAGSYEQDMHDIFALEREVTEEITRQVRAKLRTPDSTLTRLPVNPKALDLYLQGNHYLVTGERHLDNEEKRKAGDYFQQAIDLEPDFAPAYIGLANAHSDLPLGSKEDAAIRRTAAEKAFALDASSSDALVILGDILRDEFDWPGAEQEYRKAVALNPNSAAAHEALAHLLGDTGRLDEAMREALLAQELDPNEEHLDLILEWRGDYDRAIELDQKLAEIHPYDAIVRAELYRCYLAKGAHQQAIEELARTVDIVGWSDIGSTLRHAFTTSGYPGAMKEWAKALEQMQATKQGFWPEHLAITYTAIGDKDRAFYWLNQAYEHREMVSHDWGLTILKVDPLLAPLRSDPRFKDLLRRVGLPQ
ncbi:MAG TPA: winged helix-turn-helix domain-containing protein [Candidatus Bathyarchaeia archaeon]|nr:winged helix-turn-helix domain-containing protein [Candidatus Bathyarchaeia archaeon]